MGFGDIGERVARLISAKTPSQFALSALVRKPEAAANALACGATPIFGDLSAPDTLQAVSSINLDTIFHFAPPPNTGEVDTHTGNLLDALTRAGNASRNTTALKQFVYISTTGVYGDCNGAVIDESAQLKPQSARATRRVNAETALATWCLEHSVVLTILRAPGIYALDRLPLTRIRAGSPTLVADEDIYSNHIHADDLAQACIAALAQKNDAIFNIVDDSDIKMGDYFDVVADYFRLPRPPRITRAAAKGLINAQMLSFMNESRRIQNNKMKTMLGLTLRYPTITDFLSSLSPKTDVVNIA